MDDSKPEGQKKTIQQMSTAQIISFVLEFGFIIVIPLFAFGFLGKYLSQKHNNKLFLAGFLILALTTSSVWGYRRIFQIYKEYIK